MLKLNIACGENYKNDWVNLDFHTDSHDVRKVNILDGLPFEDDFFDVVYIGHFLEHLNQSQIRFVLEEVKRVLKPNGICRIVVPDLENICREYLYILDKVFIDKNYWKKYQWIVLELLDQLVRVKRRGTMGCFFDEIVMNNDAELANYIYHRTGDELINTSPREKSNKMQLNDVKNKVIYFYLKIIRFFIPKNLRNLVFINTSIGERHQWMYDKYSMSGLLANSGFKEIKFHAFNTSNIQGFNESFLDVKQNGTPRKGVSSLYVEATK